MFLIIDKNRTIVFKYKPYLPKSKIILPESWISSWSQPHQPNSSHSTSHWRSKPATATTDFLPKIYPNDASPIPRNFSKQDSKLLILSKLTKGIYLSHIIHVLSLPASESYTCMYMTHRTQRDHWISWNWTSDLTNRHCRTFLKHCWNKSQPKAKQIVNHRSPFSLNV